MKRLKFGTFGELLEENRRLKIEVFNISEEEANKHDIYDDFWKQFKLDEDGEPVNNERLQLIRKNKNKVFSDDMKNSKLRNVSDYLGKYGYFFNFDATHGWGKIVYAQLLKVTLSNDDYLYCFYIYPESPDPDTPDYNDPRNNKLRYRYKNFLPEDLIIQDK